MANPYFADFMDPRPVVVLFEPFVQRSRCHSPLNAGLRGYGFKVNACHDLKALPQHIVQDVNACVVLGGSLAQNCAAASRVREYAAHTRILALVASSTESVLISVFHSGVDAYCPISASAGLVAAAVSGLYRCTSSATGPTLGLWGLSEQAWVLVGAKGVRIPLTTGERAFLATLFGAPLMRASHADLVAAVSNAYGEPVALQSRTRLGVLIARLRRKCQLTNEPLPLKSMHGWGYMFVGPTMISKAKGQAPARTGRGISGIG